MVESLEDELRKKESEKSEDSQREVPAKNEELPYKRFEKALSDNKWDLAKKIVENEISLDEGRVLGDVISKLISYANSLGYKNNHKRSEVLEFALELRPDIGIEKKILDIYEDMFLEIYGNTPDISGNIEKLIRRILERNPSDSHYKNKLASILLNKAGKFGKYDVGGKISIYEELLQLEPNNSNHKRLLKFAYISAGRYDDALELTQGNDLFRKIQNLISDVKPKIGFNEYDETKYNFTKYLCEKYNELDTKEEKLYVLEKALEIDRNSSLVKYCISEVNRY